MENSSHVSSKEALKHLKKRVKEIGLKNYFIDEGVIGQKDCLLLIKENEQGEPVRTVACAEY